LLSEVFLRLCEDLFLAPAWCVEYGQSGVVLAVGTFALGFWFWSSGVGSRTCRRRRPGPACASSPCAPSCASFSCVSPSSASCPSCAAGLCRRYRCSTRCCCSSRTSRPSRRVARYRASGQGIRGYRGGIRTSGWDLRPVRSYRPGPTAIDGDGSTPRREMW